MSHWPEFERMIQNVGKDLEQGALFYLVNVSVVSPLWKIVGNNQ